MILSNKDRFTELVIRDCHERVHHSGVRSTLVELRSRFWVIKGRQYVKKVLKSRFQCRKHEEKPYNPSPSGALPEFRVTQAPPFSRVGGDFAGTFFVKEKGGKVSKTYLALFSCCITRALHLELVEYLTTFTFINCLCRFSSRRGTPRTVVSDNAKTFKSTAKPPERLLQDSRVQDFLLSRRIDWKFNLERSPWWEVMGNAQLTFDELSTVLSEIECTLNSRPLTNSYEELGELVLTPSHLILGRGLSTLSDNVDHNSSFDAEDNVNDHYNDLTKIFLYLCRKLKHFETGGKVGIVEELIAGTDSHVRGAKVRKPGRGNLKWLTVLFRNFFYWKVQVPDARRVLIEGFHRERK